MNEFLPRVTLDWHKTLETVLAYAQRAGRKGIVVFDLDSTVFDNRPRQARIVREYARSKNLSVLAGCQSWHFESGWDLKLAALACGVVEAEYEPHARPLKAFWSQRFFTSDYCADDVEIVGAPRYLHAIAHTGARVFYVTGRHEAMRAGTVACLAKCGMPLPEGDSVVLLMKPTLQEGDDEYKRVAHGQLKKAGTVLAVFDNEPNHINDYALMFPEALAVHLATDHSGRTSHLEPRVVSIPHFAW